MIFTETELSGAFVIEPEPARDNRGFFARTYCQREFEAHGLEPAIAQVSVVSNYKKGTIRGMHFQFAPQSEAKLARCTRGAIQDVIVDLRPESPTYLRHFAVRLDEENHRALYIPERFAQGYQVLEDNTEVLYQISEFHVPGLGNGLRYDDPGLGLPWPLPATLIHERDTSWPLLETFEPEIRRRMAVPSPVATA